MFLVDIIFIRQCSKYMSIKIYREYYLLLLSMHARKTVIIRELNQVYICFFMCVLVGGKRFKEEREGKMPVEVEEVKEI